MTQKATRPYSIRIFLADGIPDGLRLVEKSNWSGSCAVCSRQHFPEAKGRAEFKRTGVYILVGPSEDSDLPTLYIGSGEPVLDRFESHQREKPFWTFLIAFTHQADTLNKAQAQNLEARLHELATAANRCKLDNTYVPQKPSLSEADNADTDLFLEDMLLILPVLDVVAFEKPEAKPQKERLLYIQAKKIKASGYQSSTGFVVQAKSTAVAKETKSIPAPYSALRRILVSQDTLKPAGGKLVLQQDYTFSSPTYAAGVLLGMSANGRDQWKDAKGRSLNELESGS